MTIRSSASTQRWTNRERPDKEQDGRNNDSSRKGEQSAECRFQRTLVVVHLALLFQNLACGRTKFSERSSDCVLHEQIVILLPSFKVLSKEQRSRLKD